MTKFNFKYVYECDNCKLVVPFAHKNKGVGQELLQCSCCKEVTLRLVKDCVRN